MTVSNNMFPTKLMCRLPGYNAVWSPSGKFLAVIASPSVLILDGTSKTQLARLSCPETKALAFSASEQLLHTHQQPHKVDGAAAPNLKVRPALDLVGALPVKSGSVYSSTPPPACPDILR